MHCKEKIQKFLNKCSQKRNIGASVPISTFMRMWAIYIVPWLVCLFCWRKYVDRSWDYINRSQAHECWNWGWGCAIPRKGIHEWDFCCSVPLAVGSLSFTMKNETLHLIAGFNYIQHILTNQSVPSHTHEWDFLTSLCCAEDWFYVQKRRIWKYLHNTLLNALASIYFHNYIRFVNIKLLSLRVNWSDKNNFSHSFHLIYLEEWTGIKNGLNRRNPLPVHFWTFDHCVFFPLNRMDEIPNEDIRGPQKPGTVESGKRSLWGTHTVLIVLTHPHREQVKTTQLPLF